MASPLISDISATCLLLQFHSHPQVETPGVVTEELSGEELPEPGHFLRYLPGQASSSGIHRPMAPSEGPLHAEDAPPSEEDASC